MLLWICDGGVSASPYVHLDVARVFGVLENLRDCFYFLGFSLQGLQDNYFLLPPFFYIRRFTFSSDQVKIAQKTGLSLLIGLNYK